MRLIEQWRMLRTPHGRLGLAGLLAVRPVAGAPFGAIVRRHGGLTAVLEWRGARLWLADQAGVAGSLAGLAAALSGPAVQLLLRRRRTDLRGAVAGWERLVTDGVADGALASALTRDYMAQVAPALRDGGLGDVWTGLAVSGRDPGELSDSLAWLRARLPGSVRPLTVVELVEWLRDWCGNDEGRPHDPGDVAGPEQIAPASLAFTADHVRLPGDTAVCLWSVQALPELVEVGWVRHLLAHPALAQFDFDLSLHCSPVADPAAERRATEQALQAVERRLADWLRRGRAPATAGLRADERERAELLRRLQVLEGAGANLRCIQMRVAVRARVGQAEAAVTALAAALARLGMRLRAVHGRLAVERAWRTMAPLALIADAEGGEHLLPATEVAPFAWWAMGGDQASPGEAVVTVTAERMPLAERALLAERTPLLVTGEPGAGQERLLQGWATALAWQGARVLVFDPSGGWRCLARTFGAQVAWLGPEGDAGADVVAADGYRLARVGDWSRWLAECDVVLARLAPELDEAEAGAVRAALIEVGLAALEQMQPAGLAELCRRLRAGGHAGVAERLELVHASTGLGRPAPALDGAPGLCVVGWAGRERAAWPVVLAVTLRRLLREREATSERGRPPLIVLVDGDGGLLANGVASEALLDVARAPGRLDLRLWLVAGGARDLTGTPSGRALLALSRGRVTLRERGVPLFELSDGLGWPPALAALVAELPVGMALVQTGGERRLCRLVIDGLIDGLVRRAAHEVAPAPVVAGA